MKKTGILPIILLIIIIIVFGISILNFNEEEKDIKSKVQDVKEVLKINKEKLNIRYIKGNMIDDKLTYGNKITKIIEIENKTKTLLSYAIALEESELTDNSFVYNISISDEENGAYNDLSKKIAINNDQILIYDLGIDANQKQFIKIEFIVNKEVESIIKGVLKVKSNLSEKEVFIEEVNELNMNLNSKIDSLNGITESGYYILNIDEIKGEIETNIKGFILIDATDISELEYYYSIYNNKYMLKHYKYQQDMSKKDIVKISKEYVNSISFENVCREHTKKDCISFSNLKHNKKGTKETFLTSLKEVISLVKNDFNKKDKNIYIYDVKKDINNKTNIYGYILINNKLDNPEYYLYLTDNLFMVSGYNLTKYGEIDVSSSTIRAYNETAFKLSSESMNKVCTFTGFTDCVNKFEQKV